MSIGGDGSLGGFEALRLVSFAFRAVDERWSGGRVRAFMCEGNLSPRWGWVFLVGRNPALTRWAIICRPSGPGATALEAARLPRCIGIGPGSSL